jgi:hypothetical protein
MLDTPLAKVDVDQPIQPLIEGSELVSSFRH